MQAYKIFGNFGSPGDAPDEEIITILTLGQFDSHSQYVSFDPIPGGHQITIYGGPVAEKSGADPIGEYDTSQFSPGSPGEPFVVSGIGSDPVEVPGPGSHRRVSMALSYDDNARINEIAAQVGATWRGKGSWRRLIRGLVSGQFTVKKRAQERFSGLG